MKRTKQTIKIKIKAAKVSVGHQAKDKETKNKVRFSVDLPEIQGSIYVSKESVLADNDEIVMEVEVYENA